MKQIALLTSKRRWELQTDVNNYLKTLHRQDIKVIDIKFQNDNDDITIMIIYENDTAII